MNKIINLQKIVTKTILPVIRASYHENVINYFENPRNVGSLDKSKKNVGTGNFIKILIRIEYII